jgi:hypothetical protein
MVPGSWRKGLWKQTTHPFRTLVRLPSSSAWHTRNLFLTHHECVLFHEVSHLLQEVTSLGTSTPQPYRYSLPALVDPRAAISRCYRSFAEQRRLGCNLDLPSPVTPYAKQR